MAPRALEAIELCRADRRYLFFRPAHAAGAWLVKTQLGVVAERLAGSAGQCIAVAGGMVEVGFGRRKSVLLTSKVSLKQPMIAKMSEGRRTGGRQSL